MTRESKKCTKCKIEKSATNDNFPSNKVTKDGLGSWCRVCHNAYAASQRRPSVAQSIAKKETAEAYTSNTFRMRRDYFVLPAHFDCCDCGVKKRLDSKYFYVCQYGFQTRCKDCTPTKSIGESEHRKFVLHYLAAYDRAEFVIQLAIEESRPKPKNKPISAKKMLDSMISSGMYASITNSPNKRRKNQRSWEEMVGYTEEQLRIRLESKFINGMSWNNYGKWHIDHIKPKSSFIYDSPDDPKIRACWALSNLQPLWAEHNLAKKAKLDFRLPSMYRARAKNNN